MKLILEVLLLFFSLTFAQYLRYECVDTTFIFYSVAVHYGIVTFIVIFMFCFKESEKD